MTVRTLTCTSQMLDRLQYVTQSTARIIPMTTAPRVLCRVCYALLLQQGMRSDGRHGSLRWMRAVERADVFCKVDLTRSICGQHTVAR